mmetsp:Transcript_95562/g.164813  ORF Transcript_95562/g.164813 Transcript_95562/m.164813 type:complete len:111 (+) Transcript_95562:565-897(+)
MLSYGDMSKHIPQIPRAEWGRYVVIPAPTPLPDTNSARVAWWNEKRAQFPTLASIAVFFIRRPRSAAHVERFFSLIGHIQTSERLHMSDDTLRHLAVRYVNKDEDLDNSD